MADTALKFGPEWMRALCDRGPSTQSHQQLHSTSSTSSPTFQPPPSALPSNTLNTPPRQYKLAEFRYGREEMLALFDDRCRPQENLLRDNQSLTTSECQKPLALIPMSDDEHRILSRSANSDIVLRLNHKDRGPSTASVPRPSDRGPPRPLPGASARPAGPRERTVPRGFTPRSFDEDAEGSDRRGEFPRPDKRTISEAERERPPRVSESEEGQKPRKNDSRANAEVNWRGGRPSAADTDNWRSRQDKTESIAWKDRASRWRDEDEDLRSGPKSRFGYSREHWVNGDDDHRNSVPEWSLDDVGTSIGTFDASGAFMAESPGEELGGALEDDDGEWTKVGQDKRRPRRDSDREQQKSQNKNGNRNKYDREYERNSLRDHHHHPQNENNRLERSENSIPVRSRNDFEDDCFATSIEQHAEHLVAKWTEEEDESDKKQKSSRETKADEKKQVESVYPRNHPDALKWFYRDPQNAVQGPFSSQEMLGWLKEGYFQPDLLVRRGYDQQYSQLGHLMSALGRNPFEEIPVASINEVPVMSKQNQLLQLLGQQRQQVNSGFQQQKQFQMLEVQTQLRQLLDHLKRQEGFDELSEQEQQQVLIRKYAQQVEQMQSHQRGQENPNSNNPSNAGLPSIWELTNGGVMTASALEEMQRQEQEKREMEERRMMIEAEHRRRMEAEAAAVRAAAEEENQRKMREMQKKMEEERKVNEERIRLQQEEERRKLREEEERRINEEKKKVEEQRRRNEEIRRLNEEMARKQIESEAERRKEEEMEKFRQQEQERQRIKQQELERLRQHQQQQEALRRMREREPKGWGSQQQQQIPSSQMTLADIQRLQEEKDREERTRVQMQQQQVQAMYEHQMKMQKSQLSWPNSLSQASSHVKTLAEIQKEEADRLSRVKRDQELRDRENSALSNVGIWSNASSQLSWKSKSPTSAWGQPNEPDTSPQKSSAGFWTDDEPSLPTSNQRNKKLPSAFDNSSTSRTVNSAVSVQSAKSGHVLKERKNERKKEKTDEFTEWCEQTLNEFQNSLDVPTFVAFLKGLESPFDVNDYVRSYLGENKDSREFAKNFLEKRSFYRNQGKKKEEESMWGPAPAITPSVNKSSTLTPAPASQPAASMTSALPAATGNNNNNTDGGDLNSKVKSKKKKSKRVLDTSLLGFIVQADPDRINAGQIEHLD